MLITTRTPLRISFFGGGTDLQDYYSQNAYGAVLSTTINKFVYVTVKRHGELFDERYRLNYSKTETVSELADIENEIARETLRLMNIQPPIYISTVSDIPAGSGLGSSSTFAVGLVNALRGLQGKRTTSGELAEMACQIEIGVLRKPIGKQDQYATAFGGLNYIRFNPDNSTSITPINFRRASLHMLFDNFLLFWTGVTRNAGDILTEQKANIPAKNDYLSQMRDMADSAAKLIQDGAMRIETFGEMLDTAWKLKRSLASNISNANIDEWYQRALKAGAYGGKLCGAGGGGFILVCAPRERHEAIRAVLSELREVPISFEPFGSTVLFQSDPNPHMSDLRSFSDDGFIDDRAIDNEVRLLS